MRNVLTLVMVMMFALVGMSSVKAQVWNGGANYSYYNPYTNQYVQASSGYNYNPYGVQYVNTNNGCQKGHYKHHRHHGNAYGYGNGYGVSYQGAPVFTRVRSQYSYPW